MQNFDLTIASSASQRQRLSSFPNPQRASVSKQTSARIKADTKEVYKVRALSYSFFFSDVSEFETKNSCMYLWVSPLVQRKVLMRGVLNLCINVPSLQLACCFCVYVTWSHAPVGLLLLRHCALGFARVVDSLSRHPTHAGLSYMYIRVLLYFCFLFSVIYTYALTAEITRLGLISTFVPLSVCFRS